MKILFLDWNSYGNEDVAAAAQDLCKNGYKLDFLRYPFDNHIESDNKAFMDKFSEAVRKESPDFVMSFNYHPAVSKVCNKLGVKYAAWVYDNPSLRLFSYTMINPCNFIFIFDSQVYELFAAQGFKTVYYLPLAAATSRYDVINITDKDRKKWGGEVSFVGSLYNEAHNYYDQIHDKISDYSRGYLYGLMRSQMEINGLDIVEKSIPKRVMQEMVSALGAKPAYDGVETYEYIYANYVINRKITAIERKEILEMIGKNRGINLFTSDSDYKAPGIVNRGKIDYYNDMPYVFKTSDINLNITLRSIQRGIPLRAVDILGCGGFLLTNYQEDMLRFFVPDEDFVYYDSRQDLMDKIDYYLNHDEERKAIAANGHDKVKAGHTYQQRLEEIIDIVTR